MIEHLQDIAAVLGAVLVIIACAMGIGNLHVSHIKASDNYVRNRVVKLINPEVGSCTGVEIEAPSHKVYTLTAGHCRPLVKNDMIMAEDEQGRSMMLKFVAESDKYDLMLLEGGFPSLPAIKVAKHVSMHEKVHSMTHGGAAPTFRQDGEMLDEIMTQFVNDEIATPEDAKKCVGPKFQIVDTMFGSLCVVDELTERSTAKAQPGSSGGPLLNAKGELVGIVSAGSPEDLYEMYVPLHHIQDFLKDK